MDRTRARELLPVIQAFANGEDIQFRNPEGRVNSDWIDDNEMTHFELYEYRIKPKLREFYIDAFDIPKLPQYGVRAYVSDTPGNPENEWIKVREILD